MRFSEHLGSHLTPEWRSQYVQYEEMKKFLYAAQEKAPEEVTDDILRIHYKKFEAGFFKFCERELKKVETFYAEKIAEATRRFAELEIEVANTGVERLQKIARDSMLYSESDDTGKEKVILLSQKDKDTKLNKKKLKDMKFIVGEFYLSLVLIQNYQDLNFTAFRKILKKHDKIFKTTSGVKYRVLTVEVSRFYKNKSIDKLITDTETIAIEDLEAGNRGKAMKRLRVPPLTEKQKTEPAFFWGLFTGMWLILFFIIVVLLKIKEPSKVGEFCSTPGTLAFNTSNNDSLQRNFGRIPQSWDPAVRMYRGFLIILILFGLLGINVYGWGKAGVNHVLIFELDPRNHLLATEFLMIGSLLGVLWSLSCLAFLLGENIVPIYAQPLTFACCLFLFFLNPTKTFWYRSRKWLLKVLFRIMFAPFFPVKFADFWLADQLNSLVVSLKDFEYLVCFYAVDVFQDGSECVCTDHTINFMRPVVSLLPAWFRFAQCLRRYRDTKKAFPHLVNAGKYFASISVTVFSTFASIYEEKSSFTGPVTIIWILSLIFSTLFSLTWDLIMDWGLFSKNAGENFLLRDQIVYEHKWYYYMAIISDVFLRFLKPLTVSVVNSSFINHELFVFFLAAGEIVRRFIWNFFRLENEHLNNIGEFRAVRDISIKPIHKDYSEENGLKTIKRKISKVVMGYSEDVHDAEAVVESSLKTIKKRISKVMGGINEDPEVVFENGSKPACTSLCQSVLSVYSEEEDGNLESASPQTPKNPLKPRNVKVSKAVTHVFIEDPDKTL